MNLSATQLAGILATASDIRQQERPNEKRRASRVDLRANLEIASFDAGQSWTPVTTTVNDISCRGVGLVHTSRINRGQQFIIYLPRANEAALGMLCGVVHCRQVAPELFAIGAEFLTEVNKTASRRAATDADELERIRNSILG